MCPPWTHLGTISVPSKIHPGSLLGPPWIHRGTISVPSWIPGSFALPFISLCLRTTAMALKPIESPHPPTFPRFACTGSIVPVARKKWLEPRRSLDFHKSQEWPSSLLNLHFGSPGVSRERFASGGGSIIPGRIRWKEGFPPRSLRICAPNV